LDRSIRSIRKTIGLDFEILSSFQSSQFGLSKIYNELALQAKYDNIIFMHDDLFFESLNWGNRVINILNNHSIGLVGLMGSIFKSKHTSIWTACDSSLYRNSTTSTFHDFSEVAIVDGCFLAMRKNVFQSHRFDENLLGFHGYDLDISLNIIRRLKVVIANNIIFSHLSNGCKSKNWFEDVTYIHSKWESFLPVSVENVTKSARQFSDYLSLMDQFNSTNRFHKNKQMLFILYFKMLIKYFRFNKLRHSKQIMKSLFS
jgi:hypothetical protein